MKSEMIKRVDKAIKECKLSLKENNFMYPNQKGYCKGFLDSMIQVKEWIKSTETTGLDQGGKK